MSRKKTPVLPERIVHVEQPVVYQANPFIERRSAFSTMEAKLFYLCLTKLRPKLPNSKYYDDGEDVIVQFSAEELVNIFGEHHIHYPELHKIADKLARQTIEVRDDENEYFAIYPFFIRMECNKEIGLLMEFNKYVKPFLRDLADRPYTRIEFEQIWKLSSSYAIRILELLLQYRSIGERTITIENLRKYLGMPADAYKGRIDNFKKNVVEQPIQEINEKTNFLIIYNYKKKGRNVTAVHFHMVDTSEMLDAEVEMVRKNSRAVVEELVAAGVSKAMANTVVKKYGHVYCDENANYIKEKYGKTAKNLAGYIIKAIQNDYFGEHRKKLDQEVMELWPTLDKEDIDALAELAYKKGDEAAMRRLYLHQQERIAKEEQKNSYND